MEQVGLRSTGRGEELAWLPAQTPETPLPQRPEAHRLVPPWKPAWADGRAFTSSPGAATPSDRWMSRYKRPFCWLSSGLLCAVIRVPELSGEQAEVPAVPTLHVRDLLRLAAPPRTPLLLFLGAPTIEHLTSEALSHGLFPRAPNLP